MKKTLRAILLVSFTLAIAVFCYYFVRRQAENLAASLPVSGRSLDIAVDSAAGSGEPGQARTPTRARISPYYNEIFLDAFDINLDEDEDLEQVIVAKPQADVPPEASAGSPASNRLAVVIADFLPLTGSYRRVWKGETLAVKPKAFVIQPKDLLGDGKIELLCFGIDEANRQTLTIFRPSNTEGTRFKSIFSEAGFSIQVTEPQDTGVSPRPAIIQVFNPAGSGLPPLDQIRRDFVWSPRAEAYRPDTVTPIPGDRVEQNYIDKIVTGSAADFENYLDGLWIRESKTAENPVLLSFQTSRREITISGNPDFQVWDWEESSPTIAGIRSSISNPAVPDMPRLLSIDLVGMDRIRVSAHTQQLTRFAPREDWDGTYRRTSQPAARAPPDGFVSLTDADALGTLHRSDGSAFSFHLRDMAGAYQGTGISLNLGEGIYRLEERAGSRRGRYYFFRYRDALVLELEPYEEATEPSGRRIFIVTAKGGPGDGIAGIRLRPAQVASGSVAPLYKPDMELEHIVIQGTR